MDPSQAIQVVIRVRPIAEDEENCLDRATPNSLRLAVPGDESRKSGQEFSFDHIYGMQATQEQIFEGISIQFELPFIHLFHPFHSTNPDLPTDSCARIVDGVVDGFNGTIMAYGQTGAGKTTTMMGQLEPDDNQMRGLVPRCVERLLLKLGMLFSVLVD